MYRGGVLLSLAAVLLYAGCAWKTSPLPKKEISVYGKAGAMMFGRGEFAGALRKYRKALAEAERFDNMELQARYRFNIGRIFYESAFFDSARYWFTESGTMFSDAERWSEAAVAEMFLALTIARNGDVAAGQRRLMAAAPGIAPADEAQLATARMYFGMLRGDSCAVNRSGEEALQLFMKKKDHHGCGVVYYYKGMSFLIQRRMKAARSCFDSSLHFYSQSPYRYRNWKTLLGHAMAAYCEGGLEKGDRYYDRARKSVPEMVNFPDRDTIRKCGMLEID